VLALPRSYGGQSPHFTLARAIRRYYEQIQSLRDQNVDNEMNVRAPFEFLLAETGRQRGWTLVPSFLRRPQVV